MKYIGIHKLFTLTDLFVLLFVTMYLSDCFREDTLVTNIYLMDVLLMLFFYGVVRIFYSYWPQISYYLLLSAVVIFFAKETFLGVIQFLGYSKSVHVLGLITGSFDNPGPYGGFLAICISVLVAYCAKNKFSGNPKTIFDRIMKWIATSLVFVSIVLLPSTQSRAALLSLGCSIIALILSIEKYRMFLKKNLVWFILFVLFVGIGAYQLKKPSADGRMFINRVSLTIMKENGLKGVGLGNYTRAYSEYQASFFRERMQEGKDDLDWTAVNEHDRLTADCPDNAFNEYFQIGVEAGPIAMLLFIVLILYAIIVSYKQGTIWCYGMIAFAVFAMFSYPLHIIQFQILFPIILAACASSGKSTTLTGKLIMTAFIIVLSVILIGKIPEMKRHKQAEYAWKKAERWHTMEYYEYVVEDCTPLLEDMKYDYRFLFAYGQSLNKTGKYEKSDSILMLGAKISSDPMFWNVMGNNSLALGKYREAEECYKHAFYLAPNRLYPLTLLAKLYHDEGDTIRFLDMAKKVESFIPKVESVNTERLRSEIAEIKADY